MNIYVLDKQLNIVTIIDSYSSIIWTNRYYECGDFELYLAATQSLIYNLREDYMLIREGHEENAMIIETIQITTNVEDGNYLIVSGRCLKSIFYRRIIWEQTQVSGTIESCISTLINKNIIDPDNLDRKIENVELGVLIKTNTTMTAQYTGDNLGETITAICKTYGLGWDVALDLENKKIVFGLYSGVDRSYNQEKNSWVVFSDEYNNLLSTEYAYSKENYANVTKVAGEGEGLARKNTTVGDAKGIDRYEIFTDARDLSTNEGEITDEEYYSQLTEKGNEKLAEAVETENFFGEVIDYQFIYGQDYSLGDVVEVVNEYKMAAVSRVTEVIESEDESGIYIIPTFETWEGFVIEEQEEIRETLLFEQQTNILDEGNEDEEKGIIEVAFDGKEFNAAIKTLYNGSETSYETYDKAITSILFSENPPGDDDISTMLAENSEGYTFIIYTSSSDKSKIKMYSSADIVKLAPRSEFMFYGLSKVKEIDLSRFDTSIVTDMRYMFNGCSELTAIDLSNFDTSKVEYMNYMFDYCESLVTLDLSNFDTSKVEYMDYMFNGCSELTAIDVSKFAGNKVKSVGAMFMNCSKLTSIDMHMFETNVDILTRMEYMFAGCSRLTSLDLSKVNTNASTDMEYMFYYCSAMEKILVGNGWVEGKNTANMFQGCGVSEVTYV